MTEKVDYLPGMTPEEKQDRLSKISYRTFLTDYAKVDLQVVEPADFPFEAGQWISVPFGPKIVRAWRGLRSRALTNIS